MSGTGNGSRGRGGDSTGREPWPDEDVGLGPDGRPEPPPLGDDDIPDSLEGPDQEPVLGEQDDTSVLVDLATGGRSRGSFPVSPDQSLTKEQLAALHKRIKRRLEKAGDAEAKMHRLAVCLDVYPTDAVISAIPWIGDGAVMTLAVLYTLRQALKARLGWGRTAKTVGYHLVDFFVGAVADFGTPVVSVVVDHFIKANEWSSREFSDRLEELLAEARRAGVSESEIEAVLAESRRLKAKWEQRAHPAREAREKSRRTAMAGLFGAKAASNGLLEGPKKEEPKKEGGH